MRRGPSPNGNTRKQNQEDGSPFGYYDFFAGGGMAGLGLGSRWKCLMANDFSEKKARAYRTNFPPASELILKDVHSLTTEELPGKPILAWGSFPCQDLSLAGKGRGLEGQRSGSYWGFRRLVKELQEEGRPVPILVLENVVGTITANKGDAFRALLESLVELDYLVGPLVIDAMRFVPQSRRRLFMVAVKSGRSISRKLLRDAPDDAWHTAKLQEAHKRQPDIVRNSWIWWSLPLPPAPQMQLADVLEKDPEDAPWHTAEETQRLLDLMSPLHQEKVRATQASGKRVFGTIYRRVRQDGSGCKAQRAEVRFDQVSGCLRTSTGGSSRQTIIVVEGESVRSRLISTREAARLMGLPESYQLPRSYNEAYHLIGDGLVVPVVSWLEKQLLHPLAAGFERGPSTGEALYQKQPGEISLDLS
jgi:DNA (cytosine-5)-methyltransferase 1